MHSSLIHIFCFGMRQKKMRIVHVSVIFSTLLYKNYFVSFIRKILLKGEALNIVKQYIDLNLEHILKGCCLFLNVFQYLFFD